MAIGRGQCTRPTAKPTNLVSPPTYLTHPSTHMSSIICIRICTKRGSSCCIDGGTGRSSCCWPCCSICGWAQLISLSADPRTNSHHPDIAPSHRPTRLTKPFPHIIRTNPSPSPFQIIGHTHAPRSSRLNGIEPDQTAAHASASSTPISTCMVCRECVNRSIVNRSVNPQTPINQNHSDTQHAPPAALQTAIERADERCPLRAALLATLAR